jgi:putative acetyltransferase
MIIRKGDLDDPQVLGLIEVHLETSRCNTARDSAHALDASGLRAPEIGFWSVWDGEQLLGMGALKRIAPAEGEIKSMHVASSRRRTGAGSALLLHLIAMARENGMRRLNLETGSWEYFRPACAFYRRHGFSECGPFADYKPDPSSVFMSLVL